MTNPENNMNSDSSNWPNETYVGTCSICGGRVTVPTVWHSVVPAVPTCRSCGATAAQNPGPIVPMVPRRTNAGDIWPTPPWQNPQAPYCLNQTDSEPKNWPKNDQAPKE
jgi:hypothetical protein